MRLKKGSGNDGGYEVIRIARTLPTYGARNPSLTAQLFFAQD